MITGAIALVFVIAGIVCAGNGEWGPFAVCAVIVVILLAAGASSREDDRAMINWTRYWSKGEAPGSRNRSGSSAQRAGHVSRRERKEAAERRQRYIEEERKRRNDPSYIDGVKTSGELLRTQGTVQKCPVCGSIADEFNRVQYSSGAVFVNYKCRACGRTWPVKIK